MTREEIEALKEDKAGLAENLIRAEARVAELEGKIFDATPCDPAFNNWVEEAEWLRGEVARLTTRVAQADKTIYDTNELEQMFDELNRDYCLVRGRAEKSEQYAEELIKDYAEWMSPEDYVPLAQKVDDLAALVRILVHSLRKVTPNSSNIIRAMDYLTRNGLTGSILRSDEPQPQEIPESGGHIESADCWCGPTVEEHPGGTLIIHNQTH